jgi:O-antigen ligase
VIAALAVVAVGLRLAPAAALPRAAVAFLACLAALAVWSGATILWSAEPSTSWQFANRVLAYLAFACAGVVAGTWIRDAPRVVAGALAALIGAVFLWALAAKAIPSLYPDYERLARLRSPVGYWNVLAVLADVGVALALWLATARGRLPWARAAGAALLYLVGVGVLLTYSRFGITIAVLVAVAWVALERDRRVESLAVLALAAAPAIGVFGYALTLRGITDDRVTHAQRAHDGWRFALVFVAVAALVVAVAYALARVEVPEPLRVRVDRVARIAGVVVAVVAVVLVVVFARRIWHSFSNPGNVVGQSTARLGSASSSNRWMWWQEAWHAFTRHPLGGTGGGTFDLTNALHRTSSFDVAAEPHNVPLQFLSETGIVGLVLWLGVFASAVLGIVRARARENGAVTALGLGVGAWLVHMLVDIDWSYVAVCGPLLLVAGVLVAEEGWEPLASRRPLLAAAAVALALAAVYALVSPWLAERDLNRSEQLASRSLPAAIAAARAAHRWDPLSTRVVMWWAGLEDAAGAEARARRLYRDAVRREPLNPETWYELGVFEYQQRHWIASYRALDRSWGLDRHGPAGVACDYLDLVRPRVFGYGRKCAGFRRPAR